MSQQINLIIPELRQRFDWLALPLVAGIALACTLLVLLAMQYQSYRHAQLAGEAATVNGKLLNLQQQVQVLGQSVAARKQNPALPEEIKVLRSGVEQRREVLAFVGRREGDGAFRGFSRLFEGFSRQRVEGAWLTGFVLAPEAIEIRGRLLDPSLLPRYIGRLNGDPAFSGRRFSMLEMKGVVPSAPAVADADPEAVSPAPLPNPYTEFVLRTDNVPIAEGRQ